MNACRLSQMSTMCTAVMSANYVVNNDVTIQYCRFCVCKFKVIYYRVVFFGTISGVNC